MSFSVENLSNIAGFWIYCALLGACFAAARVAPVARLVERLVAGLAAFLRARGIFVVRDLDLEQRRLDILRIVLASLACAGFARNLASGALAGEPLAVAGQLVGLGLAALTLVGVAAPLATLAFAVLLNPLIDMLSHSTNLASMVLAMAMTALALAPVGRTLSLDALLLRRDDAPGRALGRLYAAWGPLTPDRAAVVRFMAFALYASVALYSGVAHLWQEGWVHGALFAWLLAGPTTNPLFADLADQVYRAAPVPYVLASRSATYLMMAWYLGLLPLVLLGRVTRWFAIAWGLGFFGFSTVVLPLRMLGTYELLLWVLVFWDRPFWARSLRGRLGPDRPGWWRAPGAAAGSPPDDEAAMRSPAPGRPGFGLVFRAVALSVAVLGCAYLIRVPGVGGVAPLAPLGRLSVALVGPTTLAYGLGPVNVFNTEDLLAQRFTLQSWWSNGVERVSTFADITPYISDTELHTLTQLQRERGLRGVLCDEAFVRDFFAPFAQRYAGLVVPPRGSDPLYLHTVFMYADWPTVADFAAFRYVPVRSAPVCEVVVDAATGEPTLTVFSEFGTEAMTRDERLPFPARPDVMPLLTRFPCEAEVARARRWAEAARSGPGSAGRMARGADLPRPEKVSPIRCFAEIEAAMASADLDWRTDNPPPPSGRCDADLALAEAYYDRALTPELRAAARPSLNGATVAHARGDEATCLLATAEVRRTYRRALGMQVAADAPDPPLVGRDLAFRLRSDAVPLLERFPCEAEARRLGWGAGRPDIQARGPLARSAIDSLAGATIADPILCFQQVETAVATLALDWLGADPVPADVPCDGDVALAEVYRDTVLDGRPRAAAQPALDRAADAFRRGDARGCLLASAEVRRAYLAAVGAREPDGPRPTVTAPEVSFAVRADALELLRRFPCEDEAQRYTWWLDRPDVAARGSGVADVPSILRQVGDLQPAACLAALESASQTIDLNWRTGHEPPRGVPCAPDFALTARYFDTVFDPPLRQATRDRLDVAVAALQQDDQVTCLLAAAGVRRMYWQRLGAPIGLP